MNNEPLQPKWVERIFMEVHGRFGNAFFDKFRIGALNSDGQDLGIENAKLTWGKRLAGMSGERIKAAIDADYEYAPSCDDFKSKCVTPRQMNDFKALAAPVDHDANKQYAKNVVDFVAAHTVDKTDYKAWAKRIVANPARFPAESLVAAKEAMRA